MEVQDRGSIFRIDGIRKDDEQEEFRQIISEVVQAQVREVGVAEPSARHPIAQNEEFVAMPPHREDTYFCLISDGEYQWEVGTQRECINLLQRI